MFTVNIKGKRDPKKIELVKLEMIFYKRGYARVTKIISITGLYSEWNQKSQLFIGKEFSEKNKFLQQQKLKYLKIGERWDAQGKDWIPVELSHYYDTDPNYRNKYIPVSDVIGIGVSNRSVTYYCDDCPIGAFGTKTCTKYQQYSK